MDRFNQKGSMLALALIFLAIFVLMGFGLINLSAIDAIEVVGADRYIQAFWLAEAGIARTLFNLRMDFVNDDTSPSWRDGDINGLSCPGGPDDNNFYPILYSSAELGNGSYIVELKNVAGRDREIWVRSTGTVGSKTRTIELYLTIENRNIWNNAIFAAEGQSGALINGNVDIRGSVHLLGTSLSDDDIALEMGGTGGIGNNYDGIDPVLAAIIPACPQEMFNDELVYSLDAKLRVRNGLVSLNGAATVGDEDDRGNEYKETVDAVYNNDGYTGNKGDRNVYSDNGSNTPYGPDSSINYVPFPSLEDGILGYATYFDYLRANALVITNPDDLAKLANINPESTAFDFSSPKGQIKFENGHLTVSGIIYLGDERNGGNVANLNVNSSQNNKLITYSGKASILVTGDVNIEANLLTVGANSYPRQSIIGIMTPNTISFGCKTDEYTSAPQLDVAGIFYGETRIMSEKQTEVAGSFVSNYFEMGGQVPSIYQVWEIVNNLPPGIIGATPYWVCEISDWHETPSSS